MNPMYHSLYRYCFLAIAFVLAPAGINGETYEVAFEFHQAGVDGDEEAVEEALAILERLLEENPRDARALALYGSACTLRARDAIFFRKLAWLERAREALDRSVEMEPRNVEVRMLRGINGYHLPKMFDRRDEAEEDFRVLYEIMATLPEHFDAPSRRTVFYYLGRLALDDEDRAALDYFEAAQRIEGDYPSADAVQAQLDAAYRRFR